MGLAHAIVNIPVVQDVVVREHKITYVDRENGLVKTEKYFVDTEGIRYRREE